MPLAAATRAKQEPNLLSRSRIRYFDPCPEGVASRSWCAVQASVGERVTPTWMTLRERISMTTKANRERKKRLVTCKKSHAQMSLAWFCRKVAQVCPRCLGARAGLIYF